MCSYLPQSLLHVVVIRYRISLMDYVINVFEFMYTGTFSVSSMIVFVMVVMMRTIVIRLSIECICSCYDLTLELLNCL